MTKASLSLFCGLLLGFAAHSASAQGVADTPANRATQADRYLQAMPTKELFASMVKNVTANVPPGPQRDQMMKMFTTGIDLDAVQQAQKDSLVKHLTADELKALADFYSSPLGKSSTAKMGAVMEDTMPAVKLQIMKAMSGGAEGSAPAHP